MNDMYCPRCKQNDAIFICNVISMTSTGGRRLMKCNTFNEYFWDDNGEQTKNLHNMCENINDFELCDLRKRDLYPRESLDLKRRPMLDGICEECPNKNFVLG